MELSPGIDRTREGVHGTDPGEEITIGFPTTIPDPDRIQDRTTFDYAHVPVGGDWDTSGTFGPPLRQIDGRC